MSQIPDYTQNVSLRLSQVLDEIGVNERIVVKRRRLALLNESLYTITCQTVGSDGFVYNFGSQSESTTTEGLRSDDDCLISHNFSNVIQDLSEWEPGLLNLLMITDDSVAPGYCMLQRLRIDAPFPYNEETEEPNKHHYRDKKGRILVKNTWNNEVVRPGTVIHGPAHTQKGQPGYHDLDLVGALPCKSWPLQANPWLGQHVVGGWPSDEMRRYCSSTGCFVVAAASKGSECSENECLEWRISTSLAERCLMFNLNITQIRCYILMKMILKTFISQQCPDNISSFMCKTVLLHCIAKTHTNAWRESRLLTCLTTCLSTLYNCVLNEECPHFIIPGNNLMAGHILPNTKPYLLEKLQYVVNSNGRALLEIDCDHLGLILQQTCSSIRGRVPQLLSSDISGELLKQTAMIAENQTNVLISRTDSYHLLPVLKMLLKYMIVLVRKYFSSQGREKIACCIITQQLCKCLGSVLASANISLKGNLTLKALVCLSFGLTTDVSSAKLKLASIFYCVEETENTGVLLNDIEKCYDLSVVEPICGCYAFKHQDRRSAFNRLSFQRNNERTLVKLITASCVKFLPCERIFCPCELQYEMFRSTQEDLAYRDANDEWMDWAVVDSLPYLYFLQYKTYNSLRRHDDKQRALSSLAKTIDEEPNLVHRETALNLLGQCMEQENRTNEAFGFFLLSLQVRDRNNAAKCHICRLLTTIINR